MKLKRTMPTAGYFKRPHWEDLVITYHNKDYWYVNNSTKTRKGKVGYVLEENDDWIQCSKEGFPVETKKENRMTEQNVNYIGGDYKVVKVEYLTGGCYNFKVDIDLVIEPDMLLVVESKLGMGLAKAVKVFENRVDNADEIKKATAWVVDIVDTSAQDKRKEATRQREYIIMQLEEKKAQMEAVSVYALLAKTDPEAEKLLSQLSDLGK